MKPTTLAILELAFKAADKNPNGEILHPESLTKLLDTVGQMRREGEEYILFGALMHLRQQETSGIEHGNFGRAAKAMRGDLFLEAALFVSRIESLLDDPENEGRRPEEIAAKGYPGDFSREGRTLGIYVAKGCSSRAYGPIFAAAMSGRPEASAAPNAQPKPAEYYNRLSGLNERN